jgi:tetratricopeptide (TPR) repeat protein
MPGATAVEASAALFDLGNSLMERGYIGAAIEVFQRHLALAPDHAATSFNLGNALRQIGRPVEAIDAFVACLRRAPDFGAAYVNLADTLRHLGLLDHARTMAELGVQHLPELSEAKICFARA